MIAIGALWAAIAVQRLVELRWAKRNETRLRARGAREFGGDHYPLFFVLHTGWLLAWPLEAWSMGGLDSAWPLWLAGFVAAQVLRYWTLGTLGERWSTRILVCPGEPLVQTGPFRLLRHPNYLAVGLELWCAPAIFGAWWTAALASVLNLALLRLVRIPQEERALSWAAARPKPTRQ